MGDHCKIMQWPKKPICTEIWWTVCSVGQLVIFLNASMSSLGHWAALSILFTVTLLGSLDLWWIGITGRVIGYNKHRPQEAELHSKHKCSWESHEQKLIHESLLSVRCGVIVLFLYVICLFRISFVWGFGLFWFESCSLHVLNLICLFWISFTFLKTLLCLSEPTQVHA